MKPLSCPESAMIVLQMRSSKPLAAGEEGDEEEGVEVVEGEELELVGSGRSIGWETMFENLR